MQIVKYEEVMIRPTFDNLWWQRRQFYLFIQMTARMLNNLVASHLIGHGSLLPADPGAVIKFSLSSIHPGTHMLSFR